MGPLLRHILVIGVLAAVYALLRMPTGPLNLAYYDDGETLYHTFSLLNGQVPYRDNFNHHFMGYVIPFIGLSHLAGFSVDLIREMAFVNQVLCGYGVFLCVSVFCGFLPSFLAALMAISAREPWVLGFFQHYQNSLLIVFVLYFALRYLEDGKSFFLIVSSFLCGVLFTFDQRVLLAGLIPLAAFTLESLKRRSLSAGTLSGSLFAMSSAPLLCLFYLYLNNALWAFIEQCFVFPLKYRVGSKSTADAAWDALYLHRYLFTQTPLLLIFGVIGFITALMLLQKKGYEKKNALLLVVLSALPVASIPLFGGRDYDYYTIPWLFYLAVLAGIGTLMFRKRAVYTALLAAPLIMPVLSVLSYDGRYKGYEGDGLRETAAFLKQDIKPDDSLFIWGYRLELYVRAEKLSAYPFSGNLLIHPDPQIKDYQDRLKHIFPRYEEMFMDLLKNKPPVYLVTFSRGGINPDSPARRALFQKILNEYTEVFHITRDDFLGEECSYRVFKLKSGGSHV